MSKIKEIYIKYKEVINYLIFGVLTTIVNFIIFFILSKMQINILINNILSWIVAVTFAYITNKKYVFESISKNKKENLQEIISFYSCRIFSLIIEELILFIFVEKLKNNEYIIKIIAQIIVIIINYILSKIIIFKKKSNTK